MATDKSDYEIWLKSRWDGDATKAAEADFRRTQKAVKDTGTSMDELGYSAKNLKAQLVEFVALAEMVAQFKEGFEQVTKLEQVMNQLQLQTKQNGQSFDDVKGKIVGFADQLKKVAGLDDDAVIAGMTKLYTATKDVEQAMVLARISADIAIATGKDYAAAQDLVMSAAQGNTRSLRELGLSFESTGDKSKDAEIALAKLQKTFGGAAEGAKGLKVEINRLSEAWEDVRNEVVDRVTPGISGAIKTVESFFTTLDGLWSVFSEMLVRAASAIGSVGTAIGRALKGDFAGAKEAMQAGGKEMAGFFDFTVDEAQRTANKVAAIWADTKNKISGGEGKAKGVGAGGEGGAGKKDGEQRDESKFVLIDGVLYSRADILSATESLYKEAKKIADREEKFAEAQRKRERADAKKTADEIEKDREDAFRRMTKQILEESKLKKAAAEAEKAMALEVANASLALAGQLFGDSKELAIASAIINTYEGATKALGQGGIYGPVLAAIVIASGLAQVAKIVSTKPSTEGAGFDDPGNDAAARIGGRRWAADMIGEFTGGVSEGWAQGMRGGSTSNTTNDNRRTFNVHMHGAGFIDPNNIQMMKQFKRTLDTIEVTVEGQRHLARTAR